MSRYTEVAERVLALCEGCDWRDEAVGALGRAASHHDRTGHQVKVSISREVIYGQPGSLPGQTSMFTVGEAQTP